MSNHRSKCQYCKQMVLSRDIGQHIIKKHESLLFAVPENLRLGLWKDKFFTKPLMLSIDDQYYYFCLADYSCIKNEILADRHFKGNEEKHKEQILKLREKYPLDPSSSTETNRPTLSENEKLYIYEEFATLIGALRSYEKKHDYHTTDLDKKSLELFNKLGLRLDDDYLKSVCPTSFPSDESETKEEVKEEVVEEDDILPLVYEKPMTKEDYIRNNFTKKDILNLSTNVATGEVQHVEELEAIKKIISSKPSAPKPVEKPKVEQPKVEVSLPVEIPKPMRPWDRFIAANPDLQTDAERLSVARNIGFPEVEIPIELTQRPQSAARIVTLSNHSNAATAPPIPRLVFNTKAPRKPKTTDC